MDLKVYFIVTVNISHYKLVISIPVTTIIKYPRTVIFRELLCLQKWSKTFRYRITPFWGVTLTLNLTPRIWGHFYP